TSCLVSIAELGLLRLIYNFVQFVTHTRQQTLQEVFYNCYLWCMRVIIWYFFLGLGFFSACMPERELGIEIDVQSLNITTNNSLAPNLFRSPSDLLYMTWIEIVNDSSYSLQYATFGEEGWSKPNEIISGTNWFVNWADIPALVTYDDKHIAAHWLQMSGDGTYDYSVQVTLSKDGGQNWSNPIIPHQQEIPAEHGFVSMAPLDDRHFQIVWLDGRNTKIGTGESDGHDHGGGQMTLRSAVLDYEGNITEEHEIDGRVCDCCQTDLIIDGNIPIVIYRDRSPSEVRDISISRYYDDKWTEPVKVHNDEWTINGCPVNGPAIALNNEEIGVAWYTASEQAPKILIASSIDGGKNFSEPVQIDQENPVGRVDLIHWNDGFMASWVESKNDESFLMMSYYQDGIVTQTYEIMPLNASRRGGFPIIEPVEDGIIVAWTEVGKSKTSVQSQKIVFEGVEK
ncbi:MAG: hypothetical protein ACI9FN_000689, partial [Saprospiraceae bacterium]